MLSEQKKILLIFKKDYKDQTDHRHTGEKTPPENQISKKARCQPRTPHQKSKHPKQTTTKHLKQPSTKKTKNIPNETKPKKKNPSKTTELKLLNTEY